MRRSSSAIGYRARLRKPIGYRVKPNGNTLVGQGRLPRFISAKRSRQSWPTFGGTIGNTKEKSIPVITQKPHWENFARPRSMWVAFHPTPSDFTTCTAMSGNGVWILGMVATIGHPMMAALGSTKAMKTGSFAAVRGAATRTTVAPPIATTTIRRIATTTSVFESFVCLREHASNLPELNGGDLSGVPVKRPDLFQRKR
jgi:hypothetical protein